MMKNYAYSKQTTCINHVENIKEFTKKHRIKIMSRKSSDCQKSQTRALRSRYAT